MISLSISNNNVYFPISILPLMNYFDGLKIDGTSLNVRPRMASLEKDRVVLDVTERLDFRAIEDAFDCEFIAMPDEINNEDEFYKWLMGVKFE